MRLDNMALLSAPNPDTLVLGSTTFVQGSVFGPADRVPGVPKVRRFILCTDAQRIGAHTPCRRRAVDPDTAQLPAAQGRLSRDRRPRRQRSARALRRGPLRP